MKFIKNNETTWEVLIPPTIIILMIWNILNWAEWKLYDDRGFLLRVTCVFFILGLNYKRLYQISKNKKGGTN